MKKLIVFMLLLFCFTSLVFAEKYKEAPLPHYNKELGYGWKTDLEIDKNENVWNILKAWQTDSANYIFLDKTKDGKCNVVVIFAIADEKGENDEPLYYLADSMECNLMDNYIKMFLNSDDEPGENEI